MPATAKRPRITNDQRHELLRYLITYNAAQYGRGDSQGEIAKAASKELDFTVKVSTVQSNIAFLQTISAVPFKLRKRGPIKGSITLINRNWERLDDLLRTSMSGRVTAELWTLRTFQRYTKAFGIRISLATLKTYLGVHGYRVPDGDPDAWVTLIDGMPK